MREGNGEEKESEQSPTIYVHEYVTVKPVCVLIKHGN